MTPADGPPLKSALRPLRRTFWLFVLVVVMPGMLMGLALAWWSAQQLVQRQEREALNLATTSAENMGNHLKAMSNAIAVLAQLPLGKNNLADFHRIASGFSANQGYSVTLADGDGNQILSTRFALGTALPRREAMDSVRKAIASGRPHVSEVFRGKMAGTYVVTMDRPVASPDGIRVISIFVDAQAVSKVVSQTTMPEGWLVGLIDEHGVFIARSKDQDQWIGKSSRPELVEAARLSLGGMIYNPSVEGAPMLNVFHRVPDSDWTFLVGIPERVLYAQVLRPVGLLVGLIVLATVLTALLAFVFYRRLNAATARMLAIARDPLHGDEGTTARNTFAEFEVVAQTLKSVAEHQQQLMAALNESNERYHTLFTSIDQGFCLIEMIDDEQGNTIDWRFLEVNPAFEKHNGLQDAVGKRMRELAPDLEPYWFKTYGDVARTGEPTRFEHEAKTLGERWFDLYAFRLGAPGSHKVAVLFKDVTKSKRMEHALRVRNSELEAAKSAAEEANLAKSNFLSSMSHELRTPLNAILGFAQLMESSASPPSPAQTRSLGQIIKAGWYLLELVNEILDLAQIDSGKVVISREAVPLGLVMGECQALVEPLAQQRGISMHFAPLDTDYYLDADQIRVKQVLINLLHNAIKYNKPAGSVTMVCTHTTANIMRISVRDTGPGLSAQQLGQLFQPFNRLGQETGGEQGTGIGLVVVKQLVELMGGTLGVESHQGVGSVFWIELNLTAAPMPTRGTAAQTAQTAQLAQTDLNPPDAPARSTVLYVEDNPANLVLVEELIARRPDLRLITAGHGTLGVELARAHLPQVILMDINLPGISGTEAMHTLRADPATAHIPVLALSAYALPADIEHALQDGFFSYLAKPIKLNEFLSALDSALDYSHCQSASAGTKA